MIQLVDKALADKSVIWGEYVIEIFLTDANCEDKTKWDWTKVTPKSV